MSTAIEKNATSVCTQLLPHFTGWRLWPRHAAIVRQTPDLVQAIMLDMPRPNEGFYICHAIYPLALQMHDQALPTTLGGRISTEDGGILYFNFPCSTNDLNRVVSLIQKQVVPQVEKLLSLHETTRLIESSHVKRDILMPYWSMGILCGLMSDMDHSKTWLGHAMDWIDRDCAMRARKDLNIPAHVMTWKAQLTEWMALTAVPDHFHAHCHEMAQKTIKTLRLPETQ